MNTDFKLLTEKDEMWAKMLMEVLNDNNIPCTALPVNGAGLALNAGIPERLKIYVPGENMAQAEDLLQELFTGEDES